MDDNDSGQSDLIGLNVLVHALRTILAVDALRTGFKVARRMVDVCPVKPRGQGGLSASLRPGVVWAVLILVLIPLSGCTVVRVAGAGVSLGATAVKTGVKAGGAAVGLTGSIVGIGTDDSDEDEDEDEEPEAPPAP